MGGSPGQHYMKGSFHLTDSFPLTDGSHLTDSFPLEGA
jgi:hypothetical protein